MIRAKFKGSSSCGFQHGRTYNLISKNKVHSFLFGLRKKNYIWIFDMNSNARCPYTSLQAFLNNWEILYEDN